MSGQSKLPAECPVCEHSPLSAEDCKPNKSLRTTIKVFLRTAEKKRETAKEKERAENAPAVDPEPRVTQVEPTESSVHADPKPTFDATLTVRPHEVNTESVVQTIEGNNEVKEEVSGQGQVDSDHSGEVRSSTRE